jgi:hypothetical protein
VEVDAVLIGAVELEHFAELSRREGDRRLDAVVPPRLSALHAARAARPVRTHVLDVNRCTHNLNIVERELRALRDNVPVDRDERATIVVKPVAVAALLIGVKIYAAELGARQSGLRLLRENALPSA